jgi:hypothetical protein
MYDKIELMKARERQFTIVYKKSTHHFHHNAVSNYDAADMLEKASRPGLVPTLTPALRNVIKRKPCNLFVLIPCQVTRH